jgi:hypothetical protein
MFDKARRAAENLPEGNRKTQLVDLINVQEAVTLLAKATLQTPQPLRNNCARRRAF